MKIRMLSVIVVSVLGVVPALSAIGAPLGPSNASREYILGVHELSAWSSGVYYEDQKREVQESHGFGTAEMRAKRLWTYIGYDLLPWMTAFGSVGTVKAQFNDGDFSDQDLEWGGGAQFNLIDQEIMDPTLFENRIRLNAGVHYTSSQCETWNGGELKWEELFGSLLVSIVNDVNQNKFFGPESIAIFAGPIYSDLMGDLKAEEEIGFTAGFQVFFTKRVSAEVAVKELDDTSIMSGLQVRF